MYYDTQRKLAFVMPPRTGTTTFSKLLSEWGAACAGFGHPKPSDVQIDNFDQYVVYGFFRNPLDRFLSLIRFVREGRIYADRFYIDSGISSAQFKEMNYSEMVDAFPKYEPTLSKFFDSQATWLANAKILNFNKYDMEILRVAQMFKVTQVNLSINNWTEVTDEVPSQKVIDFVQSQYVDDYRLGRERGLLV